MLFFGIDTRPEMFVPLIHCVSDTLSQAMPDLHGVHRRHEIYDCCKRFHACIYMYAKGGHFSI